MPEGAFYSTILDVNIKIMCIFAPLIPVCDDKRILLKPYRWYMHSISDATPAPIRINEEGEAAIRTINEENADASVYTIDGARVEDSTSLPSGMYVKNGKKIVIR